MSEGGRSVKVVSLPKTTLRSFAWKSLPCSARIVFITMMSQNKENGKPTDHVQWSAEELEQESGISLSTVKRGLYELQRVGFVTKCVTGGRWHKATDYILTDKYTGWT